MVGLGRSADVRTRAVSLHPGWVFGCKDNCGFPAPSLQTNGACALDIVNCSTGRFTARQVLRTAHQSVNTTAETPTIHATTVKILDHCGDRSPSHGLIAMYHPY